MDKILIAAAAYLVIGVLFSIFIKWGNENLVKRDERVDLGNKEHHIIATIWPMFVIVFVIALIISLLKKLSNWF